MPQNFIGCDREQAFLMPPSLRDWLPADHLAWFVIETVEQLDLDVFYADYRADGHGRAAYDPSMMVSLVLFAYSTGERSSRGIERQCRQDIAYRVITGNRVPDHATVARFIVRHEQRLGELFGLVLKLCAKGGLVASGVVAIVLALALQNTLADVFAGIAVGIEAPFRVGDRISIGDKTEGRVVQVNWRSIRIQTDGDDVITVPNSVVAKAEIANRTYPVKRTASSVEISYPVEAAPERVIETMLDATRLCREIVRSPAPTAFLTRLGERTHRQPIALPDLIIAATAVRHGLVLLTRNLGEFGRLGIGASDPFVDPPQDP